MLIVRSSLTLIARALHAMSSGREVGSFAHGVSDATPRVSDASPSVFDYERTHIVRRGLRQLNSGGT
jgi:hypothetical protein